MKKVIAEANASASNIGPGYDVLGMALGIMKDVVEVTKTDSSKIEMEIDGIGSRSIPTIPSLNTAGRVAVELVTRFYKDVGLKLKLTKGIPISSGLGGSGASAVATAVAIDRLLDLNLGKQVLLEIAASGEIASAGEPIADNAASSLFGGFNIVQSYQPLRVLNFQAPAKLMFAIAVPLKGKESTKQFREVLPKSIPMEHVVANIGGACSVVAGILTSDLKLAGSGMLLDSMVEKVRFRFYRGCEEVKKDALESGASGVFLTGAGPSMIAAIDTETVSAEKVAEAMKTAFTSAGVECNSYVSNVGREARVVHSE
jgi:homoserine kinase